MQQPHAQAMLPPGRIDTLSQVIMHIHWHPLESMRTEPLSRSVAQSCPCPALTTQMLANIDQLQANGSWPLLPAQTELMRTHLTALYCGQHPPQTRRSSAT